MANTFSLISKINIANQTTSFTFSNIPSSFDDLVLHWSSRLSNITGRTITVYFNSIDTTSYTLQTVTGNEGATALTSALTTSTSGFSFQNASTYGSESSNLFGIGDLYINKYNTSSTKYIIGNSAVVQRTGTLGTVASHNVLLSAFWNGTSTISSITFSTPNGTINFEPNSVFWLYGIKNT